MKKVLVLKRQFWSATFHSKWYLIQKATRQMVRSQNVLMCQAGR